jgi:hypothetical protein
MLHIYFLWHFDPISDHGFLLRKLRDHTQRSYHIRYESFGQVISLTQSHPPITTQHSQGTNIHASGRTRTRIPSKPAAADPHLRLRGDWNRPRISCRKHKVYEVA